MNCPRCHRRIKSQEIQCSHCGLLLKAHGHPGMTLYRANPGESLCPTCTYHLDDTCNFPKRPAASDCTLYQQPVSKAEEIQAGPPNGSVKIFRNSRRWLWLTLAGLLLLSLLLALA